MDFGTFSEEALDFSKEESNHFGSFVLIPFRASDGNPSLCACHFTHGFAGSAKLCFPCCNYSGLLLLLDLPKEREPAKVQL